MSSKPCRRIIGLLSRIAAACVAMTALAHASGNEWVQRHYGPTDGLPVSSASSARIDADGFLWIATHDGLARFDGARFDVHDSMRFPAMSGNRVRSLHDDAQGRVFALTEHGDWLTVRSGEITRVPMGEGGLRATIFSDAATTQAATGSLALAGATSRPTPVVPLLGEFSVTWRAEMAPQWRRQHRNSVDVIFDTHLIPAFGMRSLADITKADVLTFRATLAERPGRGSKKISPSTINKIMCILRQMLTESAERFGLSDVFKGVKRLKAKKPDVHPFSMEEVDRIRATIRTDYRDYVTVRFFTGMRTGEINGLKWKYVDFERGLILVREVFSAGESEENAKNETSLRDIPMLPMVRDALESQRMVRHPESEYVFCSREGNPLDAHNFATRVWYPLLRYLEIDKRRPYQSRHTTATLMLAAGENPEWIAKLMGHANTQMLFTVYSRFVPNLTRQDGRAITGLLNSRAPVPNATPDADLASMSREQLEALVRSLGAAPAKEVNHAH